MNTENVHRWMPRWLVKAERSFYVAFAMVSLATTLYWTVQNLSGAREPGVTSLRTETSEAAPLDLPR